MEEVRTAYGCPWQNPFVERFGAIVGCPSVTGFRNDKNARTDVHGFKVDPASFLRHFAGVSWSDLRTTIKRLGGIAILVGRHGVLFAGRSGQFAWRSGQRVVVALGSLASKFRAALADALEVAWSRTQAVAAHGFTRMARQSAGRIRGRGAPHRLELALIPNGASGAVAMYHFGLSRRVLDRSLATAFIVSLLLHLALYGGWRWGKHMGWWEHQATWLLELTKKSKHRLDLAQPDQPREIPLTFVEVDPALASQPPKDAKYYGEHNSRAANPEPAAKPEPKIDGNQTKMVRLLDVPRPQPQPLQPTITQPEPETLKPEPPAPKPSGTETQARPDPDSVAVGMTEAKKPERPRTLADARRQQPRLAGAQMQQSGGALRRGRVSLDVKATPFGAYDAAFIAAVQQRWYELIDSTRLAQRTGKVILEFRLNCDGRIADMTVRETEVGEMLSLLCQRAVLDPAPYAHWPSDMWRMVGKDFRDVVFTFYYE